jgi:hypothetical protein
MQCRAWALHLSILFMSASPQNKAEASEKEPRPADEALAGKLQYTSPAGQIGTYIDDATMIEMCRVCDGEWEREQYVPGSMRG